MNEWVLVPVEPTEAMLDREYSPISDWKKMVDARPPIPRAVWDAMVERSAEASDYYWRYIDYRPIYRRDADTALRAALGNPVVQGDAP